MRCARLAALAIIAGLGTTGPALAQAKASAEASAAANVNPKWAVPKMPWGHPDLEGIWTSDDMRGVPTARPNEYGTSRNLTDAQ